MFDPLPIAALARLFFARIRDPDEKCGLANEALLFNHLASFHHCRGAGAPVSSGIWSLKVL